MRHTCSLDHLATRGYEPMLESVTGTCRIEIEDEGSWLVTVQDGRIAVKKGTGHADTVFKTDASEFDQIARGDQNPFTAVLQGRVSVTGDASLALMVQRIFH